MRRTRLVIISLILVALVLPVGTSILAQDDALNQGQIALIDRAVAARNSLDGYTSYVEAAHGQSRDQIGLQGAEAQTVYTNIRVWSREATVVRGATGTTIQALIALAVERSMTGRQAAYSVDAEARVVGDVLYVNAAYTGPESDLLPAPLPVDWQVVEDVESHPVYDDLELGDLVDERALFDAPDILKAAASDVTLRAETLDDGTVAQAIHITIDAAGMAAVLRDFEAPTSANEAAVLAMADGLETSSKLEIVVVLGDNDAPLILRTTSLVRAMGVPGSPFGVSDATARLDIVNDSEREQTYSRFNDDELEAAPSPPETED